MSMGVLCEEKLPGENDDASKNREFSMGMIADGVYLRPLRPGVACFAHTQGDVDQVLNVAEKVLKVMKT
jgi:glutamate-1-semialdehyde aminotransferase